jgi:2-polyprenyl-6-methoxyphenol hydroxylase-like FAD-dependent oxidoreductase
VLSSPSPSAESPAEPLASLARGAQIVVAGGGLAGVCAAAALARKGYRVLVVEPGVAYERRLAGELLHPPAMANLRALGLAGAITDAGGQPVDGFAVFMAGDGPPEARCLLPYEDADGRPARGATVEHGALVSALLAHAAVIPGVRIVIGARVTGLTQSAAGVTVTIARDRELLAVPAELLVAADGRASNVRQLVGIPLARTRLSTMAGYLLDTTTLPVPGRGHIFAGGASTVLAYAIAPGRVRVMIDVGDAEPSELAAALREPRRLAALPEPFRAHVAAAVATKRPLVAANLTIVPAALVRGRVVLVGDAAGCCHPVSASGLASATHDAIALAEAIGTQPHDVPAALRGYAKQRRVPQRTRIQLASALYRAFDEASPEMTLLRRGLVAYWRTPRGRATSMSLLATSEQRLAVMAREYAQVAGYALPALLDRARPKLARRRALVGLLASVVPHLQAAIEAWRPERARR